MISFFATFLKTKTEVYRKHAKGEAKLRMIERYLKRSGQGLTSGRTCSSAPVWPPGEREEAQSQWPLVTEVIGLSGCANALYEISLILTTFLKHWNSYLHISYNTQTQMEFI